MSGIAGFFSVSDRAIQNEVWERMVTLAAERGRDARLTWCHPASPMDHSRHKVALAKTWTKLADGRNAPRAIASDDGTVIVAFDGVIYNVEELRELENVAPGRRLSSSQLIAIAYQEFGFDFVTKLNGDFAVAIYDRVHDTLFCARDRIGVRPFYFAKLDDALVFGSEIKVVLTHPDVGREPDLQSIYYYSGSHYRYFDSRPGHTCFQFVHQLPPATCLLADGSGVKTWRYWSLDPAAEMQCSLDEAASCLQDLLDDSVRLRIETSNQPGFMLSSGMDSASVLSLACRYLETPAEVYSSGYNVKNEYDETAQIRPSVDALGGKWHVVGVTGAGLESSLNAMLRRHDEPVSTVTWLSHFLLSRKAAYDGVRVLFGGLGGDELMAGEYEHFLYFFADLQQAGLTDRLAHEVSCWSRLHDHPVFKKNRGVVDEVFSRLVEWKPAGKVKLDMQRYAAYQSALLPEMVEQFGGPPAMDNPFSSYLKNRCYQDLFFETTPCCLRADDRNVSSFGMRSCYPFLDYRIVELGFALPSTLKYQDGVTKQVLRTAMKGIVPENNRTRTDKVGWNAPSVAWFRNEWAGFVADLISSREFRERGVYDPHRVRTIYEEHRSGEANHMMFLWQMINIELWFQHWYPSGSNGNGRA